MKPVLFFFIFLASLAFAHAQTTPIQPMDGTDCSNLFFKALLEEDDSSISGLVASDFTVVGFQGQPINGPMLQQAIKEGYIVIDSGMLTATSTRNYGNVVVVSGQWSVSARIQNNNFQGDLAYMSVCVKAGGSWKVAAVQLTPIK
ncbi:nuclear transport factor 2 family protein [Dyadobacter arcticus]|uniref:DUF4440 domain-containing protein n=1 Tax=Dyadobacter arcticus TaxID=1078754 RepID=A0ABX0USY8_9BACT|nr:nuclear transport factor 2 family protein [Dyadobacter arcticus]NIJ56088.1 hypothetical protein [Dyadobacter arcticus]